MKRYCLAVVILLMMGGIKLTAFAVGEGPVVLSGIHKPTYYPPTVDSHDQGNTPTQIPPPQGQIQVKFRLVGETNEPIPGAQLNCRDGAGNSINPNGLTVILDTPAGQRHNPSSTITDDNGEVTIAGSPGNWQFSVYKSGFFSNALIYPFTYSTSMVLMLQAIDPLEKLNLSGHGNKKEFTEIRIIMPAFCSNATEPDSNLTTIQPTYTGDEG